MLRFEQDPDGKLMKLVTEGVGFLGEQDGPPEARLKAWLSQLFAEQGAVQRAYLAIVQYPGSDDHHVALCLATGEKEDLALVRKIGEVFRSLFGSREHLDTIFLDGPQEMQVARVCKPFYAANHSETAASGVASVPEAVAPPEAGVPVAAAVDFTAHARGRCST